MLTDDDCRAIREAIGQPAMSFDRVRELVRAINAMQDGPVWVVPRDLGGDPPLFVEWLAEGRDPFIFPRLGELTTDDIEWAERKVRAMTAAGAAEVGEE